MKSQVETAWNPIRTLSKGSDFCEVLIYRFIINIHVQTPNRGARRLPLDHATKPLNQDVTSCRPSS